MPDSSSELARRYRLLTVPTVIVLGNDRLELERFKGESQETVGSTCTQCP